MPLSHSFLVLFACFLLLLQAPCSFAQTTSIDSLENILRHTNDDSTKLEALNSLVNISLKKDLNNCYTYILKGIQLAEKQQDQYRLYTFYYNYSRYLSYTNTLDTAVIVLEKASSYLTPTSPIKSQLDVLTLHAEFSDKKGDISMATKKYLEALKIAKSAHIPGTLVSCYIGLGRLFASQKMYPKAIEYTHKCEGICDELAPNISPICLGITYSNLSKFHLQQQQIDSSIFYSLKAIKFKEQANNLRGLSFSYNALGGAYLKKKDTLTALLYFEKSFTTTKKIKDIKNQFQTLIHISKIHVARKSPSKLNEIIILLDSIFPKIQNPKFLINYYQIKSNYFELKKEYKNALEYWKKRFEMVDSFRRETNTTLIASLETKYRTDQHKLEKELAQKETLLSNEKASQSKRNLIGVAIFTLLIILLLLYILSRLNIIKQQQVALNEAYDQLEQQKQNEVALLNLKALQAQMNPHFLFNALNSIQDLVLLKDIKNSTIYLGKFSNLIRKILLSSKEQFISLEKEIEILQLYLDLEKLRFGDQFEMNFTCTVPSEKQSDILLPAMFIQPYIENAIKHGLFHKKGLKKLLIEFSITNDFLTCVIEDNGVGQKKANEMKLKMLHLHTGFSTEAIEHRVKFLNQSLNKNILIKTEDLIENQQPIGTRVSLQFSLA